MKRVDDLRRPNFFHEIIYNNYASPTNISNCDLNPVSPLIQAAASALQKQEVLLAELSAIKTELSSIGIICIILVDRY